MLGIFVHSLENVREKIHLKGVSTSCGVGFDMRECLFAKDNSQRPVSIFVLPSDKYERNPLAGQEMYHWFVPNQMHFGNCGFEASGSTLF